MMLLPQLSSPKMRTETKYGAVFAVVTLLLMTSILSSRNMIIGQRDGSKLAVTAIVIASETSYVRELQ